MINDSLRSLICELLREGASFDDVVSSNGKRMSDSSVRKLIENIDSKRIDFLEDFDPYEDVCVICGFDGKGYSRIIVTSPTHVITEAPCEGYVIDMGRFIKHRFGKDHIDRSKKLLQGLLSDPKNDASMVIDLIMVVKLIGYVSARRIIDFNMPGDVRWIDANKFSHGVDSFVSRKLSGQ